MLVRKAKNRSESDAQIPLGQVALLSVNFLLPMHISKTQRNAMILMKMGKRRGGKGKGYRRGIGEIVKSSKESL